MSDVGAARLWGGPDDDAAVAPDDDLLRRLALWLADVSAEAALAATPPERVTAADSADLHGTDETGESARGEPTT